MEDLRSTVTLPQPWQRGHSTGTLGILLAMLSDVHVQEGSLRITGHALGLPLG